MYEVVSKKYPLFVYKGYSISEKHDELKFSFEFRVGSDIVFYPEIRFPLVSNLSTSQKTALNNIAFHLGLAEIPSYWKATCSPEIVIDAGYLDKEQIKFWETTLNKGLREFFYNNKINFKRRNLVNIKNSKSCSKSLSVFDNKLNEKRVLVPVGGGKDSIVTLEAIKTSDYLYNCLLLNPSKAAIRVAKIAGCKSPIIVKRVIDKRLLKLNEAGYLNGHTPFSAYLAFVSVAAAVLYGYKYIALSNERSADEGNILYNGLIINHQWSKTFEFEKLFNSYSKKYLATNIHYFSFLRSLYEIQIARLFSKHSKYFNVFRSCNSGLKMNKWCNSCPKCLFTFIILYPFLSEEKLMSIFGKNLFTKQALLPIARDLSGISGHKPFDCVGTKNEVIAAINMSIAKKSNKLPFLLQHFNDNLPHNRMTSDMTKFGRIRRNYLLPESFSRLLSSLFVDE